MTIVHVGTLTLQVGGKGTRREYVEGLIAQIEERAPGGDTVYRGSVGSRGDDAAEAGVVRAPPVQEETADPGAL